MATGSVSRRLPPDADDEAAPEPSAAAMDRRRFWRRFIHKVYDLLAQDEPMTVEEIL